MIKQTAREVVPDAGIERVEPRELLDGSAHLGAELVVRLWPAREPDDDEPCGELSFVGEVVERGDEFAFRQVARRAEDDERARFRRAPRDNAVAKRILGERGFHAVCAHTSTANNSVKA
jgi:hypothetical protein